MADRALSTSRRTLLGAAAALLPAIAFAEGAPPSPLVPSEVEGRPLPFPADPAIWNERLTRYTRLFARAKAAAETGWFRAANERYECEAALPATDRKAAFRRVSRAERLYWRRCTAPMQAAATSLVLTPAPHLTALRQKLAVIRAHHLHEEDCMERDCIEVLEEDVGRLETRTA